MLTIESTHASYFISDVHLSDARRDITERFIAFFESLFLNGTYPRNVFILGDLFNTWLGDDVTTPLVQQITRLFQRCEKYNKNCTKRTVRLYKR